MNYNTTDTKLKSIDVPIRVGAWVSIYDTVDIEEDEQGLIGFTGTTVFEDKVAQYVPETKLLRFENSDVGYAEFVSLLDEHGSVQVVMESRE